MANVTVPVLQHNQTGKVHIVELELMELRHCYCSLNRQRSPEKRQIDLTEEHVCETCVKGFLDDEPEEKIEGVEDSADFTQLRESIEK